MQIVFSLTSGLVGGTWITTYQDKTEYLGTTGLPEDQKKSFLEKLTQDQEKVEPPRKVAKHEQPNSRRPMMKKGDQITDSFDRDTFGSLSPNRIPNQLFLNLKYAEHKEI